MEHLSPSLQMFFDLDVIELGILFHSGANQQPRFDGHSRSSDGNGLADLVERQEFIIRQKVTWTYASGDRCTSRGYIRGTDATIDSRFLDFCRHSKKVRITLLGKPQRSARFSGEEVMLMCGRNWPTADSVENVARSVRERNAYPLPEPEIPGGGKSLGAQGQTRKPGSHRDNCEHN